MRDYDLGGLEADPKVKVERGTGSRSGRTRWERETGERTGAKESNVKKEPSIDSGWVQASFSRGSLLSPRLKLLCKKHPVSV